VNELSNPDLAGRASSLAIVVQSLARSLSSRSAMHTAVVKGTMCFFVYSRIETAMPMGGGGGGASTAAAVAPGGGGAARGGGRRVGGWVGGSVGASERGLGEAQLTIGNH